MSFFLEGPQALTAAASNVAGIGSDITAANAAAAAGTTSIEAAAADAVSAQVAALFSKYGQGYQQISAQVAAFHEHIAQTLVASANAYASTEAAAAQSLASAVNAPAAALLGQPLVGPGSAASGLVAGVSGAASQVQSAVSHATGAISALAAAPTGGVWALTAAGTLLGPAAAEIAPAAVIPVSWATAIENAYLVFEPWVQYGFQLAAYVAGWVPYVGILAPQINFFYNLFEPMVQAGLFNTLDWLDGSITFATGWENFWSTTAASINYFIQTEIWWIRSFFPPLPPLPII
ncbi:PE family protein [Mycobacterium intermedium]|uniref:PE family protein n=1 Tax=Mycobacterium intermedium TaxID=28445 RepID=A0A1E3SEU7_MYCIE|nr:PE family protein [Mycobacterium intermedium]MCV6965172.1 PE family protein [Mycobacterium intermedium]ODR00098.1 PE family protein [Mycobacterium intermedium]OPE45859.1 PE family protein [Mycobacterium intermedium]ORA99899.1 PE family protein [Mycobacterium intermedium]